MAESGKNPASLRRILVVDDDQVVRGALQKNLEKLGYETHIAEHGKAALLLLEGNQFDLVVSDIRMPEMDGLELTRIIKQSKKVPIILMTGFSEILETQAAHQLGADEFLAKPFKRQDLVDAIERCLGPTPQLQGEADLPEFCRLGLEDFISGKQIQYDIFVRLSDRRFVKVATGGEDLSVDRIRAYRSKGMSFLYLKREDFRKYVGFSLSLAKAALGNKQIAQEKKQNLLRHTGEILLERVQHDGLDKETCEGSAAFVEMVVEALSDDIDAFGLLEVLNSHTEHHYAHGVAVSYYSVLLAKAVGWNLPANRFKVALGGLFHDVGEKEIPPEILKRPRREWSVDEVRTFESHPLRGMEILSSVPTVPSDVAQIVKEHHEDCIAQGYPSRLKRNSIHPMARLVAVANVFCERVIHGPEGAGLPPNDALQRMSKLDKDRLDPQFFDALKKLFGFSERSFSDDGEAGWA